MNKRQAALFAQTTIDTTLPQLMETLYTCNISSGQYNQICLYNEMIRSALLTAGVNETTINVYETTKLCLIKSNYLQIQG